jgi:hypothetical protein
VNFQETAMTTGLSNSNSVGMNSGFALGALPQPVVVARATQPGQETPTPQPTATTPGASGQTVTPENVAQLQKQMEDGVNTLLQQVLGSGFTPPKNHAERVLMVDKALKQITDPQQREAFIAKLEELGKPFGINFGLSRTTGGAKVPLNDAAFKAIDANRNSPASQVQQRLHGEWKPKETSQTAAEQPPNSTTTPQLSAEDAKAMLTVASKLADSESNIPLAKIQEAAKTDPKLQKLLELCSDQFRGNPPTTTLADLDNKLQQLVSGAPKPEASGNQSTTGTGQPDFSQLNPQLKSIADQMLAAVWPLAERNGGNITRKDVEAGADKNPALKLINDNWPQMLGNDPQITYQVFQQKLFDFLKKAEQT